MTENQNTKCHAIIHSASAAAFLGNNHNLGGNAIPVLALQVAMIIALGKVFDIHFTKAYAESLVKAKLAKKVEKRVVGEGIKLIPFVGNIVNSTIAASDTEALGWDVVDEFSKMAC